MKIGILCADSREVTPFIPMIKGCKTTEKAMLKFHQGKIENVEAAALFAGAGKTNAALATQILIDAYDCDVIINAGTAGGMAAGIDILDTVICTESAYYDVNPATLMQCHPMLESIYFQSDDGLLEAAKKAVSQIDTGYNVHFGRMATGDQFIVRDRRDAINKTLAPLSVDMETAAAAHVCYVNKVPFLAVRTVTDTERCSGESSYQENCDRASQISADIVKTIIGILREMYYYEAALRCDSEENAQSNEMKEKFIAFLAAKGVTAEMGLTPVTSMFVMHTEQETADEDAGDYWFVETDGDIETKITNFIRWNISRYIFAYVEDEDYRNGRYATGLIKELKDYGNPEGIRESKEFMTMTFDELVEQLR